MPNILTSRIKLEKLARKNASPIIAIYLLML